MECGARLRSRRLTTLHTWPLTMLAICLWQITTMESSTCTSRVGRRSTFASGLYHPVGMVCDSAGNLYVAENRIGNLHEGSIYRYKPDGSRVVLAVLSPSDRPSDLAFDTMGNLLMADLGGKVYKYQLYTPLRRQGRIIFGSVPNSARSLACDSANNLFVVDAGDVNGSGNAIYKFTTQAVRTRFAPNVLGESFACLAVQPMPVCCQ